MLSVKRSSGKVVLFSIIIVILCSYSQIALESAIIVKAQTKTEAWEAITTAAEKAELASSYNIDVSMQVQKINEAINDYHAGNYTGAYEKANLARAQIEDLIKSYRWGRVFPYILIPINIVLVAAIVVFFGKNIVKWFKKEQREEFLNLEIVYEEKEEEQSVSEEQA
jgi:hypothetical protein